MRAPVIDRAELRDRVAVFRDRAHAGELLADLLEEHGETHGTVLAVPAGGVPVGLAVSRRLKLPFDVCVVSKITPSWNTEVGYGAVAFDGTTMLNDELIRGLGVDDEEMARGLARTQAKVAARVAHLRGDRPFTSVAGGTVFVVDDGLASGITMRAAVAAVRKLGARRVVVAVPTGHLASLEAIAREADAVYCVNVRGRRHFAVADAYVRWEDVTDATVEALVKAGRADPTTTSGP